MLPEYFHRILLYTSTPQNLRLYPLEEAGGLPTHWWISINNNTMSYIVIHYSISYRMSTFDYNNLRTVSFYLSGTLTAEWFIITLVLLLLKDLNTSSTPDTMFNTWGSSTLIVMCLSVTPLKGDREPCYDRSSW